MKINEIVENAGYDPEYFFDTKEGKSLLQAVKRFEIGGWESEEGDQVGVSLQILLASEIGMPIDKLYWQGKVSPKRKKAYADAQNII